MVADEAVVPKKSWEHDGGKGLCCGRGSNETKERALRELPSTEWLREFQRKLHRKAKAEPKGLEVYLAELQLEMKERCYVPKPVRRVYIPKPNGKQRPLGIPTIRDRIVQTAFLLVLEPIFDVDFAEGSDGFRPGRARMMRCGRYTSI